MHTRVKGGERRWGGDVETSVWVLGAGVDRCYPVWRESLRPRSLDTGSPPVGYSSRVPSSVGCHLIAVSIFPSEWWRRLALASIGNG